LRLAKVQVQSHYPLSTVKVQLNVQSKKFLPSSFSKNSLSKLLNKFFTFIVIAYFYSIKLKTSNMQTFIAINYSDLKATISPILLNQLDLVIMDSDNKYTLTTEQLQTELINLDHFVTKERENEEEVSEDLYTTIIALAELKTLVGQLTAKGVKVILLNH
jgi:hypothetical protein